MFFHGRNRTIVVEGDFEEVVVLFAVFFGNDERFRALGRVCGSSEKRWLGSLG